MYHNPYVGKIYELDMLDKNPKMISYYFFVV